MFAKMTLDLYKKRVYDVWGDQIRVIGKQYKNMNTGVSVCCEKCGYGAHGEWNPRPVNLLNHHGCPECSKKIVANKHKIPEEQYKKEMLGYLGSDYHILGTYTGANNPIQIKHLKCGYDQWFPTIYDVKRGIRCPRCRGVAHGNIKEFSKYVNDITQGHYKVISKDYLNNRTPLHIEHMDCKTVYSVTPHNFKSGCRCPHCKRSHGEYNIQLILEHNNIKYEYQKRFNDCKYKRTLPFDFYLPDYNFCIEYDGSQHYKENHFFMNHSALSLYQLRDSIKDWYCQSHGIYLIRIPYKIKTLQEIEEFLDAIL